MRPCEGSARRPARLRCLRAAWRARTRLGPEPSRPRAAPPSAELRARSEEDLRRCERAAQEAFEKGDMRAARAVITQLTYYTKISEEIAEKERQLEVGGGR